MKLGGGRSGSALFSLFIDDLDNEFLIRFADDEKLANMTSDKMRLQNNLIKLEICARQE